jgi:hypothetical protein
MNVERRRNLVRSSTHLALCRPFDVKADDNTDTDRCEERHRGDREARTEKPTIMKIEDAEADADQQEGKRTDGRVQLRFPGRAFGPEGSWMSHCALCSNGACSSMLVGR